MHFPTVALAAIAFLAPAARGQGVQYTLMPSADYVRWDAGLALERSIMFGGRGVVDFGRLLSIEGNYLVSGGVVGRFSEFDLTDSLGAPLGDGSVDITTYGLRVRMNLGTARMVPFLRAGGGLIRFDGGSRSGPRQIALAYGGGLRVNLSPRLRAEFIAEDLRFRVDRATLAPAATAGSDPERDDLRSNVTLGASVGFVLGGAPSPSAERWSFASIPLEAFTGRLDFAESELGASNVVGVRAGVDAGRYVGLRAFYMRGVSSGYSALEGVEAIGGEAQFNLNALPRIAPYLLLGGGTFGFGSDARDSDGGVPADRAVLILGAGTGIRLTDKLRLNVAARDFISGRRTNLEDVSAASEVQNNWLYSAGISFNIGRRRHGVALVPDTARIASAAVAGNAPKDTALAPIPGDSAAAATLINAAGAVDSNVARTSATEPSLTPPRDRTYQSAATVLIPIPTEGELYIRYGPPAQRDSIGRSEAAIAAIRDAARRDSADTMTAGSGDAVLIEATLRRLFDERRRADSLRMHDLIALEIQRWRSAEGERPAPAAVALLPAPAPGAAANAGDVTAALQSQREAALAEQQRLQRRIDSLEAVVRRQAAAQQAADDAQPPTQTAAEREAADRERARLEAAERERALRETESRIDAELEQRRSLATTLVERSIPSVTGIRDTERGVVIVLGNNLFGSGSGSLGDRAHLELRAVANLLALYPEASVLVEGHTDSTGSAEVNQRLSEARAEAVRTALIAHGASSANIVARGFGQERPVASNATAEGRARNRRAEVVILGVQRSRATPDQ